MSLYYHNTEIREIDDFLYTAWFESDNPKAEVWQPLPEQPAFDPTTHHAPQWDGAQWVAVPISEAEREAYRASLSCNDLQAMKAIQALGMVADYETWIAAPERTWEEKQFAQRAKTWERMNAFVLAVQAWKQMTDEQVDQFFELARTL